MCWCNPSIRTPNCGGPTCYPPPPASYWEAFTNSDLTEGRGFDVTIAFFSKREDAVRAAHKRGPMGVDADVREVRRPIVFDSYAAFEKQLTVDARQRALSKLTAEDRRILGLD